MRPIKLLRECGKEGCSAQVLNAGGHGVDGMYCEPHIFGPRVVLLTRTKKEIADYTRSLTHKNPPPETEAPTGIVKAADPHTLTRPCPRCRKRQHGDQISGPGTEVYWHADGSGEDCERAEEKPALSFVEAASIVRRIGLHASVIESSQIIQAMPAAKFLTKPRREKALRTSAQKIATSRSELTRLLPDLERAVEVIQREAFPPESS